MKRILTSLVLVILLFPSIALGETMDDLVEREGIHYKKFTDVPFTGKTTGRMQGSFKNGVKEGPWVSYHDNGQLHTKGTYKDGERDSPWVEHHDNGLLSYSETYKNGSLDGPWVEYHENGQLALKGTYKDRERDGP